MDESERLWRVRVGERFTEVGLSALVVVFLYVASLLLGLDLRMQVLAAVGVVLYVAFMPIMVVAAFWHGAVETRRRLRRRDYDDPSR